MKSKLFIGIDIGGTKMALGVVDANGRLLARDKMPVPKNLSSKKILDFIIKNISIFLKDYELKPRKIAGIGVGVPGLVHTDNKTVLITPNLNLTGLPLGQRIEKRFKIKTVVGNDVNLGLLGEKWLGAGKGQRNIIGLFPGTGIGGAVIINNQMLIGSKGAAGEFGHMIIDIHGPRCSCGNFGCLEALAGRWAIERDIRDALRKKTKTILKNLIKNPQQPIKSKILKEGLKRKDPLTQRIMKRVAENLGKACISLNHVFNPDMIILGGGIIEACGDFILPKVRKVFHSDPFFAKIKATCPVVASKLADDAVILGAVAGIRQKTENFFLSS